MRSTKFLAILLILVIVTGIFSLSTVFSSLLGSVIMQNTGRISATEVAARSGSPEDIQYAVNIVTAGGGTVYIPAGDFVFNPTTGTGVTVPAGVNLVGAGKNLTILRETVESIGSTMIFVDGMSQPYNTPNLQSVQKPVRIQGISLIGFVPSRADADTTTNNVGLIIRCVKDFIVYDCEFSNFVNMGLFTSNNMGWSTSAYIMRGVISHCDFDQPYKDDLVILNRIWGYGIVVVGSGYFAGTAPIRDLLGHYDDVSNVVYIEDCNFRRCRHAIASSGGGYYVARHNNFTEMIQFHYGSYIDVHGTGNGAEIYNNTIENSPVDYRTILTSSYIGQYLGMGIGIRGGGGVIFNNQINNCTRDIQLYSDLPSDPNQKVKDFWIWNNLNAAGAQAGVTTIDPVLGTDYFLRAPSQAQDNISYTSYPYPHPLTLTLTP